MNLSSSQLKALGNVLTFAAFVLFTWIFSDVLIKIWPLKIGELNWRVGFTGLFIEGWVASLPALSMLFLAAFLNNQRTLLRVLSFAALALGIILLGLLLTFALDATQLRATIPQNMKGTFMKAVLKAALGGTFLVILFPLLFTTVNKVLKSAGTVRTNAREKETAEGGLLMVGNRGETPARPSLRAIDPSKEVASKATKDIAESKDAKSTGPTELAVDL
jgi:hypothetical protein